MRLMAAHTTECVLHLVDVCRIHHIGHGMLGYRMAEVVAQGQHVRFVLVEVVFRQPHLAVEYRDQVLRFQPLRHGVLAVALEAKRIAFGPQQLRAGTPVRLVTDRTTLPKRGLVVNGLLLQIGHIGVATKANAYRIRLRQSGAFAGVRIVAIRAIPSSARMLYLGSLDQLRFIVVTRDTKRLHVTLRQDHLPVLRRFVANFAGLLSEWRVDELRHQLGRRRLMGIVASQAIGSAERLIAVRLLQARVLGIVTIEAKRRRRFGQVEIEFWFPFFSGFVRHMAGLASHVERRVTTAFFWNVQPDLVTAEAEILFLSTGTRLQQLVLVVARVRIMALQAIADRRTMNCTFEIGSVFVGMAGEAQGRRRCSDQLDAGNVLVDPDLVATHAACGHGRVNRFALLLIRMTFQTLCRICVLVERNRVGGRKRRKRSQEQHHKHLQHPIANRFEPPPILSCYRHVPRTSDKC